MAKNENKKTTKSTKPKTTTKKEKSKTPCKCISTYETINVDDLSKQKALSSDLKCEDKKECKDVAHSPSKDIAGDETAKDMIIIHEEQKPWSLPFTISIAVASVLILLAMITGFPTIMYTILSATAG